MKRTMEPAGQQAYNQKCCKGAWWAGTKRKALALRLLWVSRELSSLPNPQQFQAFESCLFCIGQGCNVSGDECMQVTG